GYAYTEWSTDGGTTWQKGEVAQISGDSPLDGTVVTYHGVDKVGLMSADQTITVWVASTGPSVSAMNASVKTGMKAKFRFNVTSVTPLASQVTIQIRTMRGRTLTSHHYDNVTANSDQSRSFRVRLKAGKYYIRILAVDQAGNNQTMRGKATLRVR
ncbi:MAG: hypothetical protein NTZ17_04230, partial [Phycisphaerae bacterium]|nr:hypothetical protein [Phycisphaerae bacterium]